MVAWTYSGTKNGYAKMWNTITIKGGADDKNATRFAKTIIANEGRYRAAGLSLGVPWYFIGALHMRESSCNFAGVLHNGEHIIGTGRKTRLVPAGRGPFSTWEAAASDAMLIKNFGQYRGQWKPSLMGYVSELFNGLGNIAKGVNSAYLWAGSNHEQLGKYVRDHVFDPRFDDPQIGTMTVIKRISELRPDVASELVEKTAVSGKVKVAALVGGTAVAAGGGTIVANDPTGFGTDVATSSVDTLNQIGPLVQFVQGYGLVAAAVFAIAIVIGVVGYQFYKRRLD